MLTPFGSASAPAGSACRDRIRGSGTPRRPRGAPPTPRHFDQPVERWPVAQSARRILGSLIWIRRVLGLSAARTASVSSFQESPRAVQPGLPALRGDSHLGQRLICRPHCHGVITRPEEDVCRPKIASWAPEKTRMSSAEIDSYSPAIAARSCGSRANRCIRAGGPARRGDPPRRRGRVLRHGPAFDVEAHRSISASNSQRAKNLSRRIARAHLTSVSGLRYRIRRRYGYSWAAGASTPTDT